MFEWEDWDKKISLLPFLTSRVLVLFISYLLYVFWKNFPDCQSAKTDIPINLITLTSKYSETWGPICGSSLFMKWLKLRTGWHAVEKGEATLENHLEVNLYIYVYLSKSTSKSNLDLQWGFAKTKSCQINLILSFLTPLPLLFFLQSMHSK